KRGKMRTLPVATAQKSITSDPLPPRSSISYLLSSIFYPHPSPEGRKRSPQPRRVRHTIGGRFGRRLEQLAPPAGLTAAEFAHEHEGEALLFRLRQEGCYPYSDL